MTGGLYEAWPRREVFDFFSRISDPFYSVTFRLDVTRLYTFCKERGLSFYYALIYLSTRAVNETEAFSYALRGGELVKLPARRPSFTDLKPGAEAFQTGFIDMSEESDELIFFSCLPWLDLTALTNERDFNADDAVPRLAWGKYAERDGRLELGCSVEVNHRFIDGLHLGRFAGRLQALIDGL